MIEHYNTVIESTTNTEEIEMIKNSKQQWQVGQSVTVGFVRNLTVIAKIPTPGDYAPDAYILNSGDRWYSFVPHNGLTRISEREVLDMISESDELLARQIDAAGDQAKSFLRAAKLRAEIMAR